MSVTETERGAQVVSMEVLLWLSENVIGHEKSLNRQVFKRSCDTFYLFPPLL